MATLTMQDLLRTSGTELSLRNTFLHGIRRLSLMVISSLCYRRQWMEKFYFTYSGHLLQMLSYGCGGVSLAHILLLPYVYQCMEMSYQCIVQGIWYVIYNLCALSYGENVIILCLDYGRNKWRRQFQGYHKAHEVDTAENLIIFMHCEEPNIYF